MTHVDVDERATSDLLSNVDYTSNYSRAAAERLVADFEGVLEQLRSFPESGVRSRIDPDLRLIRRRYYLYVYFYRPGSGVLLLRILPGKSQRTRP